MVYSLARSSVNQRVRVQFPAESQRIVNLFGAGILVKITGKVSGEGNVRSIQYSQSSNLVAQNSRGLFRKREKVYFRSQILERPSIGEYWNISGVPVLPEM